MMKFLQYTIVLAVFIPMASLADPAAGVLLADSKAKISLGSEGEDAADSLQTARFQSDFQDSLQTGRRKVIKEVAKARRQPKPERIDNRPPPDPANDGANRRPPAAADQGGRGGMRPGGGMNDGGGMNRGGGMNGGANGGNGGGRGGQAPPPPRQGR